MAPELDRLRPVTDPSHQSADKSSDRSSFLRYLSALRFITSNPIEFGNLSSHAASVSRWLELWWPPITTALKDLEPDRFLFSIIIKLPVSFSAECVERNSWSWEPVPSAISIVQIRVQSIVQGV